jgi:hypothetical protein
VKPNMGKLTRNQGAIVGLVKLSVFLIIVAVVAYSDIQFVIMMGRTFPDGIARIFSIIGAFATGLSVIALLIAELYWFVRGKQMLTGWLMTAIEVGISIMNVLTSFQLVSGHVDALFAFYLFDICPATPLIAVIGWIIIFMFDETHIMRHDEREMEYELREAEREHRKAQHQATMQLRTAYLQSHTAYMMQHAASPQIQSQIEQEARRFAAQELSGLTGSFVPAALSPRSVDADPGSGALPSGPLATRGKTRKPAAQPQPITLAQEEELESGK